MRVFYGLSLILVGTTLWCASSLAETSNGEMSARLHQRLDKLTEQLDQVKDLKAEFVKRKTTPLLREPMTSRGQARAVDGLIRWDTTKPHPSRTLIDGQEIRIYFPKQNRLEVYPIDQRLARFGAGPLPRIKELTKRFDIEQISPEQLIEGNSNKTKGANEAKQTNPQRYLALQLIPTEEKLKEHIKAMRVLLDTKAGHLLVLEMDQGGGERISYRFKDIQTNVGLDKDRLRFDLPEDVKVTHPLGE